MENFSRLQMMISMRLLNSLITNFHFDIVALRSWTLSKEGSQLKTVESRWDANDPDFRNRVIGSYQYLVKQIANRAFLGLPDSTTIEKEDMISEGQIGLIKAIERFNPRLGTLFTTFASSCIHGEIAESLRSADWAPRSLRRKIRELDELMHLHQMDRQRRLGSEEFATAIGISTEDYHDLIAHKSGLAVESIEVALAESSNVDVVDERDVFEDPLKLVCEADDRQALREAVVRLNEREKEVLRFFSGARLKDLGAGWEVTESRACQIKGQALRKLAGWLTQEVHETLWLAVRLDTKERATISAPERETARIRAARQFDVPLNKASAKTIRIGRVPGS